MKQQVCSCGRNYRLAIARKACQRRHDWEAKNLPRPTPHSPSITAAGAAAGRRFAPAGLRLTVLERDGYQCRYCGVKVTNETANIDHVVAWPEGMTVKLNLVTACRPCNLEKGRAYVIPRPLLGSPMFRLYRRPKASRNRHRSARGISVRRPLKDPWIREGPQSNEA